MKKTLEQRIAALEEMVAEIHAHVVLGKEPPAPGDALRERAMEEFLDGRPELLDLYIKRGGQPP